VLYEREVCASGDRQRDQVGGDDWATGLGHEATIRA
jgi:hypothetical protein